MRHSIAAILFLSAIHLSAGIPATLPSSIDYDEAITPPADYFGYTAGERHITHAELTGYMRLLATQSDRVEVVEYGRTHGHRPLLQLLISSPENLARADTIAAASRALTDPEQSQRLDLAKLPVVVNLNYSVHGNEPSGANAAPAVAWYLAAATGQEIASLLANTVILLDPCLNPDGFDRFANWSNDNVGKNPNPDPNTREHVEPWPNGRTNYYWFDLNRDWMLLTQPESRGRLALYHRWMPQFVLDFHEMGTDQTYFFQPGVPERTHPLIPDSVYALTEKVSHYFAQALDETGSLYYTRERYDDFYAGKGSTISDLKGAIGILFEQASARGIIQDSVNGPVSFAFAIQNQITTSLAVLKAAHELRQDFLEHTRDFYRESMQLAEASGIAGYRFASPGDPRRARAFVEVVEGHGIKVEPVDGEEAWFIPVRQPQYRYLQALVEQRREFAEDIFYDITAWSLPLAYNLQWEAVDTVPLSGTTETEKAQLPVSNMGYLVDWNSLNAPRLLLDLLQQDILVKVAREPFVLNGTSHGYGTLFVPVSLQADKQEAIHSLLEAGVGQQGVAVQAVSTFLTEEGIDLGSASFKRIAKPEILLVTGRGLDTYLAGAVWHLLDVQHDYPVTLVDRRTLATLDLRDYSAIILPGAGKNTLPQAANERLADWVRSGGSLVCMGKSVEWLTESGLVKFTLRDPGSTEAEPSRRPFANSRDDDALQAIKGAIFEVAVDQSHPLAYGMDQAPMPVFVETSTFLMPSTNPYQTPLAFTGNPLLAGYASGENLARMAGSAAAVVEPQGDGAVIAFTINPVFRAYWRATEKLLLNAVLFGNMMKED